MACSLALSNFLSVFPFLPPYLPLISIAGEKISSLIVIICPQAMLSLPPLGDLTHFLSSNIRNDVYVVTEDKCIKSNGVLLAARSAKIEEILEKSENIPAVQFSDNMAGLEDCLDLVYGGSVDIREDNFKSIYKFGKLFQICEMMAGVLAWIVNDVRYDKFWRVYFDLKNLHEDISVFVAMITGYLSATDNKFMEHTYDIICRCHDTNAISAIAELLSRINDIRVLYVMENIIDTATEINETPANTTSSKHANHYLQEVVCSTVIYIENYLKSGSCNEFNRLSCRQTLQKAASVCTDVEVFRTITRISFGKSIQHCSCWNFTALSIKDLNWVRVKLLTSPATPYGDIKYFTENAGTGIHPCVVLEIVLKWWRVRTDREQVDMSFITPLITTIQNVDSDWYNTVCGDKRYKALMRTLDITEATTARCISYSTFDDNRRILKDCIRKGDGIPAQLEDLWCSYNMERYRQSVPAFTYNTAVFPPFGDTKHHWYILTLGPFKYVSLITNCKEEILYHIKNVVFIMLNFVPLPDT